MKKETTLQQFDEILKKCDTNFKYNEFLSNLMTHFLDKSIMYEAENEKVASQEFNKRAMIIFDFLVEQGYFDYEEK